MKIGIDKISFYTPNQYVDLVDLAKVRNIDKEKFLKGIMQEKMSFSEESILDMAYMSSKQIISKDDKLKIDYVIFATESSNDLSKALSIPLVEKLGLSKYTRAIEIKQACYSGTAALMIAKEYIRKNKEKKVLVVMSDISKYGLNTNAESTQGAGSIAIIVSKDPKIAVIEDNSVYVSENINDFYRPIEKKYPVVDSKLSLITYENMFFETYNTYCKKYNKNNRSFHSILFHTPYVKLPYKILNKLSKRLSKRYLEASKYNKIVGNIYTGSLYLNLLGLLSLGVLKKNSKVGMFSYGSGASAEFFVLKIQEGYEFFTPNYDKILKNRKKISIEKYEEIY